MPAPKKLTDEQVKKIRGERKRGARVIDLAAKYGVDRKTISRRLDELELADIEQARRKAEERAGVKRRKRWDHNYRNPARAPEWDRAGRPDPSLSAGPRSRKTSGGRIGFAPVPLFPNTRNGNAERFAYYEDRQLDSYVAKLDFNDVRRGYETPAERRAREAGARPGR